MRLRFHIGGPAFHPVAEQASAIERWLGAGFQCEQRDGVDAFDDLDRVDLLVLMGLHWTGMTADWAGKLAYRPMTDASKASFEAYVRSGRPILAQHGGVASYDDWPRFGQLVGVSWVWNFTSHSPFGRYRMHAFDTGHPVVEGVGEYELEDEIYYALALNGDMAARVHAGVEYEGVTRPMVITAEGGRVAGAGRLVYLANGHDMRAFACPAVQTLWCNAVRWLLR